MPGQLAKELLIVEQGYGDLADQEICYAPASSQAGICDQASLKEQGALSLRQMSRAFLQLLHSSLACRNEPL